MSSSERVRVVIRGRPLPPLRSDGQGSTTAAPHPLSSAPPEREGCCGCWAPGDAPETLRYLYPSGSSAGGERAVKEFTADAVVLPRHRHTSDGGAGPSSSMAATGADTSQAIFFEKTCAPLVARALGSTAAEVPVPVSGEGGGAGPSPPTLLNATVFAYGQTGSGKTFTIDGRAAPSRTTSTADRRARREEDTTDADHRDQQPLNSGFGDAANNSHLCVRPDDGIVPRALCAIFDRLQTLAAPPPPRDEKEDRDSASLVSVVERYSVDVSFVEIYNEQLFDLLNPLTRSANLRIRGATGRDAYGAASSTSNSSFATGAGTKQRRFFVENAMRYRCGSAAEAYAHFCTGRRNKVVRPHAMNTHSSRSHTIFTVSVGVVWVRPPPPQKQMGAASPPNAAAAATNTLDGRSEGDSADEEEEALTAATSPTAPVRPVLVPDQCDITFVDLAGSERIDKILPSAGADVGYGGGPTPLLRETQSINTSLLALGKVIQALAERSGGGRSGDAADISTAADDAIVTEGPSSPPAKGSSFRGTAPRPPPARRAGPSHTAVVPIRDSKLTMLLSHALGGNCLTTLIACIRLEPPNAPESLSTLTFATRARRIVNTTIPDADRVAEGNMGVRLETFRRLRLRHEALQATHRTTVEELTAAKAHIEALERVVGRQRRALGIGTMRRASADATAVPLSLLRAPPLQRSTANTSATTTNPTLPGADVSDDAVRLAEQLIEACRRCQRLSGANAALRAVVHRETTLRLQAEADRDAAEDRFLTAAARADLLQAALQVDGGEVSDPEGVSDGEGGSGDTPLTATAPARCRASPPSSQSGNEEASDTAASYIDRVGPAKTDPTQFGVGPSEAPVAQRPEPAPSPLQPTAPAPSRVLRVQSRRRAPVEREAVRL